MIQGSTQPLTEMNIMNISWGGKGGRCVGLTTLPPSCADCLEIWVPQPPGTPKACPELYRETFIFTYTFYKVSTLALHQSPHNYGSDQQTALTD